MRPSVTRGVDLRAISSCNCVRIGPGIFASAPNCRAAPLPTLRAVLRSFVLGLLASLFTVRRKTNPLAEKFLARSFRGGRGICSTAS